MSEEITDAELIDHLQSLLLRQDVSEAEIKVLMSKTLFKQQLNLYVMASRTTGLLQERVATCFGDENEPTNFLYIKHNGVWKPTIGYQNCNGNMTTYLKIMRDVTEKRLLVKSFSSSQPKTESVLTVLLLIKDVNTHEEVPKNTKESLNEMEITHCRQILNTGKRNRKGNEKKAKKSKI